MRSLSNINFRNPGIIFVCFLCVALGFSLAVNFMHMSQTPVIAASKNEYASNFKTVFSDIADDLSASVVNITSEKMVETNPFPGLDDFFGFGMPNMPKPEKQLAKATGTGFIVRSDGYIMTNDHVVGGADRVTVRLSNGKEYKGSVLRDPRTDLALVKIDADNLPAAHFADSDKVKVGQWAMAIGSPFGLKNTVTVGVISAIRKDSDPNYQLPYPEVIQTDASINPGNSGGPLVDIDGAVVGINGAIYSTTGSNVGIGFAIPANTAKYVISQLIKKGKVVRGYLGLLPVDVPQTMASKLGTDIGALVESVDKDSAADKGGVKVKDVIVKVNDTEIKRGVDLRHAVEIIPPGSTIKMVVIRDKKEKTLNVTLGEAPTGIESQDNMPEEKIGMGVQDLTPAIAKQIGVDDSVEGVVVNQVIPGSAADRAGIRQKDVISEIENYSIKNTAQYKQAINKLKSGDTAVLVIYRGKRSMIIEMDID